MAAAKRHNTDQDITLFSWGNSEFVIDLCNIPASPMETKWNNKGGGLAATLRQLSKISEIIGGNGGNSYANMGVSGGWQCKQPDCWYCTSKTPNKACFNWCNGCKRPKAEAVKPPPRSPKTNLVPGQPQEPSAKEKRKEKRLRKKAERDKVKDKGKSDVPEKEKATDIQAPAAAQAAPAPVPPDPSAAKYITLSDEVLASMPNLASGAIREIIESFQKDFIPNPKDLLSAEEVVIKLLDNGGPTAKAAKKEEATSKVQEYRDALALLSKGGPVMADAIADMKGKLTIAEAALTKLSKDTPSQEYERKVLLETKSKFETAAQLRRDAEGRGAAKSDDRKALRKNHIQKLEVEIAALKAAVAKEEADNDARYKAKVAAQSELDTKVLAILDTKIAAAQQAPAQPGTVAAILQPQSIGQQAIGDEAEVEQLRKAQAAMQLEAQAMQAKYAAMATKLEAVTNKIQLQFNKGFEDVFPDQLPQEVNPDARFVPTLYALHKALDNWLTSGAMIPFNWHALAPVTADGPKAVDIARELIGKIWSRWYCGATPPADETVPRQVVLLLHHRLNQCREAFVAVEGDEARAKESYDLMRDSAKRKHD